MNVPPNPDGGGFAGFGDLVSDVSKDLESAKQLPPAVTPPARPIRANAHSAPARGKAEAPSRKWYWAVAIGLVIILCIALSDNKESRPA